MSQRLVQRLNAGCKVVLRYRDVFQCHKKLDDEVQCSVQSRVMELGACGAVVLLDERELFALCVALPVPTKKEERQGGDSKRILSVSLRKPRHACSMVSAVR